MIGIIYYGAGNVRSLTNALQTLGHDCRIVKTPAELTGITKVIMPGDGAAGSAMQNLLESGLIEGIPRLKIPFLGICIGMQLLADFSEEGGVECLSVIAGKVRRFNDLPHELKIPHMGWNQVSLIKKSPLTEGVKSDSYFYFVHSYYFDGLPAATIGETLYGEKFASVISFKNFYAVQFHPEKSGEAGLKLLSNFCRLC